MIKNIHRNRSSDSQDGSSLLIVVIALVLLGLVGAAIYTRLNNTQQLIKNASIRTYVATINTVVESNISCTLTFNSARENDVTIPCTGETGPALTLMSIGQPFQDMLESYGLNNPKAYCQRRGTSRFIDIAFDLAGERRYLSKFVPIEALPCHDYLTIGPKIVVERTISDYTIHSCGCGTPKKWDSIKGRWILGCHHSIRIECPEGYRAVGASIDCRMKPPLWDFGFSGVYSFDPDNPRMVKMNCCGPGGDEAVDSYWDPVQVEAQRERVKAQTDGEQPNYFLNAPSATCSRMEPENE